LNIYAPIGINNFQPRGLFHHDNEFVLALFEDGVELTLEAIEQLKVGIEVE
jgi:hypothetical protein